ncbi:MAG: phosphatase PAP2 family protein [Deltaproteobacteria bacterium]|nr:phosphatase PAP2 family protein [Deltaproteobacteria bacterium]
MFVRFSGKCAVILLATVMLSCTAVAGAGGAENGGNYWKGYLTDTSNILTSPARWEKEDWIKASLVVGITAGLYAYDENIRSWAQKKRNSTSDDMASFAKPFGDGRYTLPPLGLLYLGGRYYDNERARQTAMLGLESFVVTGVFTQTLKFSTHRHRPDTGDPHTRWDGPGSSNSDLSFPSGHASSAFAVATVIAAQYNDSAFIPPLAYAVATLAALSRVNDDAHWASDAFLGSAIGYFTAKAIVGAHRAGGGNMALVPAVDGRHAGFLAAYRF